MEDDAPDVFSSDFGVVSNKDFGDVVRKLAPAGKPRRPAPHRSRSAGCFAAAIANSTDAALRYPVPLPCTGHHHQKDKLDTVTRGAGGVYERERP